jgi:hypothetical protein
VAKINSADSLNIKSKRFDPIARRHCNPIDALPERCQSERFQLRGIDLLEGKIESHTQSTVFLLLKRFSVLLSVRIDPSAIDESRLSGYSPNPVPRSAAFNLGLDLFSRGNAVKLAK